MILKAGTVYQEREIAGFRDQGYEFAAVDGGFVLSGWQGKSLDELRPGHRLPEPEKSPESAERFERFVKALESLCVEHGVQLSTSAYDTIQAWPLENPQEPIYCGIENELN